MGQQLGAMNEGWVGLKRNGSRLTDIENKLVVTSGERGDRGNIGGRGMGDTNYWV